MYMYNEEKSNRKELRHDEVMNRVHKAMANLDYDDVFSVLSQLSEYKNEEIAALIRKLNFTNKTQDEKTRWSSQLGYMIANLIQEEKFDTITNSDEMSEWDEKQAQFNLRAERTGVRPEDLA